MSRRDWVILAALHHGPSHAPVEIVPARASKATPKVPGPAGEAGPVQSPSIRTRRPTSTASSGLSSISGGRLYPICVLMLEANGCGDN